MFNMKASTTRRLLQQQFNGDNSMEATTLSPQPVSIKNTSISNSKRPFNSNNELDSSMALAILILLTFLFFISFFSVYINIRRFSSQEQPNNRHRRTPSPTARRVVMKKGLDPSTISALPLVSYRRGAKQGIFVEDCIICLSEFEEGEMVKLIPNCKHVFHSFCIDTWLESHVSCPLCRCTQLLENVGEVWLDVDQRGKNCGNDFGGRSTAADGDTSQEVVGSNAIRRFEC